jgi:lipopolysaccharide transport system ATP-binding protein
MHDLSIEIQQLCKKYQKRFRHSLIYGMMDMMTLLYASDIASLDLRKGEFWALHDIKLSLKRGDCLGLIGKNGAGKSTLIRLMGGIIKPSHGSIAMRGRVLTISSVRAGISPVLTGRENIFVNGLMMGYSSKSIKQELENIIEFAEIGEFIDLPTQFYSEGMKARLGFSIALHAKPEILLADELFSVGDIGFRLKCIRALEELKPHAIIVIASHATVFISQLCNKVLVLDGGRAAYQGENISEGLKEHYSRMSNPKEIEAGSGEAKIHSIELNRFAEVNEVMLRQGERLSVRVRLSCDQTVDGYFIRLIFMNSELKGVAACDSKTNGIFFKNTNSDQSIDVRIPCIDFSPGEYSINIEVLSAEENKLLCYLQTTKKITIEGPYDPRSTVNLKADWAAT